MKCITFVYYEGSSSFPNPSGMFCQDTIITEPKDTAFNTKVELFNGGLLAKTLGVNRDSLYECGQSVRVNCPYYKDVFIYRYFFEKSAAINSDEDDLYGCIDILPFTYDPGVISFIPLYVAGGGDPIEYLKYNIDMPTCKKNPDAEPSDVKGIYPEHIISYIQEHFEVPRDKAIGILSCFGFEIGGKFVPIIQPTLDYLHKSAEPNNINITSNKFGADMDQKSFRHTFRKQLED